ncbi:hypothetical protein [Rhizorhapis sp.]|uniref:hypothetical protein n=1 Tax=Rhizorhapis sp. TaxID=1968842 RepID=UPI002B4A6EBC|nr:hypothetical protein [Rhizorhapis sp.]HKR15783.1 hypothetical protein [Rhizorhapis sp.]HKX35701.1 hypothetical protein [Rhizorhapis sp.]
MIDLLFRSKSQRERDLDELAELKQHHGSHTAAVLKLRATDLRMDPQSRKRWKRLVRLV